MEVELKTRRNLFLTYLASQPLLKDSFEPRDAAAAGGGGGGGGKKQKKKGVCVCVYV